MSAFGAKVPRSAAAPAPRVVLRPVAAPTRGPTRKSPRRVVLARGAVAIAVAGLVAGALVVDRRTRPHPTGREIAVVTTGTIAGFVRAQGRLEPLGTVRVGASEGGQVVEVRVALGERVRRGQILARLEDLEQRGRVGVERARLDIATVENIRSERRLDELLDAAPGAIALPEDGDLVPGPIGDAQADVLTAIEEVAREKHALAIARAGLDRRTLRAPMDGVVLERNVEPGETIAPSPPALPLFVLATDLAVLRLRVPIDERYGARVRPVEARIHVPALGERELRGVVRAASPQAASVASPAAFEVTIDVPNRGGALRPGMSASVDLPMETGSRAQLVPLSALRDASEPGRARIHVKEGAESWVTVDRGVVNDRWAEIVAPALAPGTHVILK